MKTINGTMERGRTHAWLSRRGLLLVIGTILALQCWSGAAMAAQHMVFVEDDADLQAVAASVGADIELQFEHVAHGFTADLTDAQVRRISRDSRVVDVEADHAFALMPFKRSPFKRSPFKRNPFKRHPFKRGELSPFWMQLESTGLARIGGADLHLPDADVDIAVLDSGVDPHPDLNLAGSYSCVPGEGSSDLDGHGTMIAGLAAARDNDLGIKGVVAGARIWNVRVAGADGTIMESAALCGLEWVVANADTIEVANMSWGGESTVRTDGCSSVAPDEPRRIRNWRRLQRAARHRYPWRRGQAPSPSVDPASVDALEAVVCEATDAGVTLVAAAGNDSENASNYLPAAWNDVLTVSSLSDTDGAPGGDGRRGCLTHDRDDTFSSFSNYGAAVDIAAPGECLLSTDVDGDYAVGSGTSFAAGLASGVAALYALRDPSLTPEQVRAKILATAEPGPIRGDFDRSWEGVLRVGP